MALVCFACSLEPCGLTWHGERAESQFFLRYQIELISDFAEFVYFWNVSSSAYFFRSELEG